MIARPLCQALVEWDLGHLLGHAAQSLADQAMDEREWAATLRQRVRRSDSLILAEWHSIKKASHMFFRRATTMRRCAEIALLHAGNTGPQGSGIRLSLAVAHLCGEHPSRPLRAACRAATASRAALLGELATALERPVAMKQVEAWKQEWLAGRARAAQESAAQR